MPVAPARRAVAINQVALAPGHPTAAAHLLNLGRVELRLGHVDDAIAHLGESVHGYRSSHGEDTYDATRPLAWLALAVWFTLRSRSVGVSSFEKGTEDLTGRTVASG